MQFFKDFYKYDDIIEAPEYGSTEYEQENKRVEILGKQYDDYLKGIKKHLPRNFFDVYYKYSQFQDWDLTVLNFDHTVYNHPTVATVYKGNIIKNLIMDCQSYTKYRPNETTGGIFVSWRRKEELPTGA